MLLRYIEFLYASGFNSITLNINRKTWEEGIEEMFSTILPNSPFVDANPFKKDIGLLTSYFMRLSQSESVALHLKSNKTIMPAEKFHVDGYEKQAFMHL